MSNVLSSHRRAYLCHTSRFYPSDTGESELFLSQKISMLSYGSLKEVRSIATMIKGYGWDDTGEWRVSKISAYVTLGQKRARRLIIDSGNYQKCSEGHYCQIFQ